MSVAGRMVIVVCLIACPNTPLAAEDWPHWRGPRRNDVVAEPSGWTAKGWLAKEPAWKNNVGEGSSSPIIVGQHLFVMGWRDQQDSVYCLNAATGKEIWSVSYKCPQYGRLATGDEGLYSGPTSTPEYDAATGFLYTLSCDGDLNCWDTNKRGSRVWGVNLYEQYAVKRRPRVGRSGLRDYGYTTAPLVHGDWDHHSGLDKGLRQNCDGVDQPIAALLQDLKQRGLLDSTVVVWGSEFGRTSLAQGKEKDGRDHHPFAFSMWLAGGGVRGGTVVGQSDDFGWRVAEDPVHVHDFHATLLHLFGLDHLELTHKFQGRDFRLTDVGGQVVKKLLLNSSSKVT